MGRSEGYGKGSLVPWPLEEIVTAELLLCEEKRTRSSAANTLKGRSCMLRGGINVQASVHRKQHCFVENVFTDVESLWLGVFIFLYFCIWRGERFLVV